MPPHLQLDEAVAFCLDSLHKGAIETVADRAAAYVTARTWKVLVKKHRSKGCDDLADVARTLLEEKNRLHALAGEAAGALLGFFGRARTAKRFAKQMVSRIPLPWDIQIVAVARGLQIAGICACVIGNRDLTGCACLRDILKTEGKAKLEQLMKGAAEDWKSLPDRAGYAQAA